MWRLLVFFSVAQELLCAGPGFIFRLMEATTSLLEAGVSTSRLLARIVGVWKNICLLRRPILSILFRVYELIHYGDYDRPRPLSVGVRRDMYPLMDVSPAMVANLGAHASGRVYATDAIECSRAVVYDDNMSRDEIAVLSESRIQKRWPTLLQTRSSPSAGQHLLVSEVFTRLLGTAVQVSGRRTTGK